MAVASGTSSRLEVTGGSTEDESKFELLGSRSYLYIDIDSALLIPQLEITTQKQSQQQLILLRDVVRQLKMYFNKKFDKLFQEKEESFEKIKTLNERLDSVLAELRMEENILRPSWLSDEKPEMDLPTDPGDVSDVKVDGTNSGRTSAGGGKDHHRKRAHMMSMESGSGKNTIPPPLFMKIKKPETFTDEEVAAAESYEAEVQRMTEKGHFRKRELEAEKNQLQVQIEDIVAQVERKEETSEENTADTINVFLSYRFCLRSCLPPFLRPPVVAPPAGSCGGQPIGPVEHGVVAQPWHVSVVARAAGRRGVRAFHDRRRCRCRRCRWRPRLPRHRRRHRARQRGRAARDGRTRGAAHRDRRGRPAGAKA